MGMKTLEAANVGLLPLVAFGVLMGAGQPGLAIVLACGLAAAILVALAAILFAGNP
jgi:hypothetical protein